MKLSKIINICEKAIPKSETWGGEEPYGIFNADPEMEVNKILYCVTPTDEVIKYFNKNKYDLLISHHPFVKNVPQLIYHTALDCCKDGLNDWWKNKLGIVDAKHFDQNLGWIGSLPEPVTFETLVTKVEKLTGIKIDRSQKSKDIIETVAICTGLGGMVLDEAEKTGADCYIFGELLSESQLNYTDMSIIEAGHTATEKCGCELFQKLLPTLKIDLAPSDIDYYNDRESPVKICSEDYWDLEDDSSYFMDSYDPMAYTKSNYYDKMEEYQYEEFDDDDSN